MGLRDLAVEIVVEIMQEVYRTKKSMRSFIDLRRVSKRFDDIVSRMVVPDLDLRAWRKEAKAMTRPVVKWVCATITGDLYPSTGPFAFVRDAASSLFRHAYKIGIAIPLEEAIDATYQAIVASNDVKSVFAKLIQYPIPDPNFHNLGQYRRRTGDQEWTSEEDPKLFYGLLQISSAYGSSTLVESLIPDPPDLGHTHRVFGSAIEVAILSDQVDSVHALYRRGIRHLSTDDGEKSSLLLFAAWANRPRIVNSLLTLPNVDVNFRTRRGVTTLLWAARRGWTDIVRRLLQMDGIDPNPTTRWRETPLAAAVRGKYEEVVTLFIDRRDVHPTFHNGRQCPLRLAVDSGSVSILHLLLNRYSIDPNTTLVGDKTIMCRAAELGHESIVSMLLLWDGVDSNLTGRNKGPPIFWAAVANQVKTTKLLLDHEYLDLNLRRHGSTMLKQVVMRGHVDILKLLLDHKDLPDYIIRQALQVVARSGNSKMLWHLLTHDEVVRKCRRERDYAIGEAAKIGRDKILKDIVGRGFLCREWTLFLTERFFYSPTNRGDTFFPSAE